jgi:hypothetical protein
VCDVVLPPSGWYGFGKRLDVVIVSCDKPLRQLRGFVTCGRTSAWVWWFLSRWQGEAADKISG